MRTYFFAPRSPAKALYLLLALLVLMPCAAGWAQTSGSTSASTDDADLGEAAQPIKEMRGLSPKTLIFVFDVSGSMKSGGNLRRAREATVTILREAARPGDRVVLWTFGAGTKKVFDQTIQGGEDKAALIEQVPTQTEAGAGTNIRRPHHESLKIADGALPHETAIVLLTDSFNDEPNQTDATYTDYKRYYTPGGQLTKYPNTPENRDYVRLLGKLKASGKLHQYGIGINLDSNGRPIERLPQAAPPPSPTTDAAPTVTTTATPPASSGLSPVVWAVLGVGALALIGAGLFIAPNLQSTVFRITGGPTGPKDFSVKSGQTVRLGGDGANGAWDAYPVPGASVPVAHVKAVRGRLVLVPASTVAPVTGGQTAPSAAAPAPPITPTTPPRNPNGAARVYHNGIELTGETPLDFGDEVRITLPSQTATGGGMARDVRLKFNDPKKI